MTRQVPRPATVTTAIVLLIVGFGVLMIDSALLVAAHDEFTRNVDAVAEGTDVSAAVVAEQKSISDGRVYIGACSPLMFALALLPMGLFVLRGRNGARVALCVTASIAILVAVCCSLTDLLPPSEDTEFHQRVHEAHLQTRPAAFLLLSSVAGLSWMAAIVLLLLPASNAYFQSRRKYAV